MVGRPYGYTEEYQSYEQTGSTTTYPGETAICDGRCSFYSDFYCSYGGITNESGACTFPIITPTYGYVTRTRTVTYDVQSGLFSTGVGVPFPSRNGGIYGSLH